MKASIKIMQGKTTLFEGTLTANPKAERYEFPHKSEERFLEDLFNIERYINTQGAYRCHVSIIRDKGDNNAGR